MDCAPLNLAHFHERRADRFMRHHRYDEAYKAVETSLLYLQDAYKMVNIGKSFEVLNTLKWDFERKLCQIQMRKQQHEKLKFKEIVPLSEANSLILPRQEAQGSGSAQLIARSIDKTIANFDAKFNKPFLEQLEEREPQQQPQQFCKDRNQVRQDLNKENVQQQQQQHELNSSKTDMTEATENDKSNGKIAMNFEQLRTINIQGINDKPRQNKRRQRAVSLTMTKPCDEFSAHLENVIDADDNDEIPSLAPLELPAFDFNVFTTSAPSLAYIMNNDNLLPQSTNQPNE